MKKDIISFNFIIFILFALVGFDSFANSNIDKKHSDNLAVSDSVTSKTDYSEVIQKINNYISNIKSSLIEFDQIDQQGSMISGKLILDLPYKFRCNYDSPFPLAIIGNKNYVSVYDYDLHNMTNITAKENIFYFLLANNIAFEEDFDVISVIKMSDFDMQSSNNRYLINASYKLLNKKISIIYDTTENRIISISLYENDGIIRLHFVKQYELEWVSSDIFNIKNPRIYGPSKRITNSELAKKYKIKE